MIIERFAGIPQYEQIIALMKQEIKAGVHQAGERIPSVRELSQTVGVNPNTVQRAYTELVRQGYLDCAQGVGYFVITDIQNKFQEEINTTLVSISKELEKAKQTGVTKDDVILLVNKIWSQKGDKAL